MVLQGFPKTLKHPFPQTYSSRVDSRFDESECEKDYVVKEVKR